MSLPSEVRIGPHTYAVAVVDTNSEYAGNVNHHTGLVKISHALGESQPFQTFLHEVLHAMNWTYSLGLGEKTTDRLATGLASFLTDNGYVREDE